MIARATLITASAMGVAFLGLQAFVVSQIPVEPELCTPPLEYSSDLVFEEALWFLGVLFALPTVVWTIVALRMSRYPAREVTLADAWGVLIAVGTVSAWWWSFGAMSLLGTVSVSLPEGVCDTSDVLRAGTLGVFLLAVPLVWAVAHLGMLAYQRRI
ncbi:MAG: hypothetical protein C0444_11450 [Microbacterium sp.]|nr:hypothetical protein [Microbacterium sp.]MBA4345353.1 hypothetical protein [Microbacterium sp.]